MWDKIFNWSPLTEHFERQALVNRLESLTDHQLDDIGLRRDQLDALRLPAKSAPPKRSRARVANAVRPSLQGCG
jgi:hypothetical protein